MKVLAMFRDWENPEEDESQTVIFSERDPADVMYVILAGRLQGAYEMIEH